MDGICVVCGEILSKYNTMMEHLLQGSNQIDSWKGMSASHEMWERRVRASNFKEVCFCGSKIEVTPLSYNRWAISCSKCDYVWAES
jgi:hypothetical protein